MTKAWYVLKVQSGKEEQVKEGLEKRVKVEGLEEHFGEIIVPVERVSEIKGGKKRVAERKFYPGYVMIEMEMAEKAWFLVRETPGVGDFVGSGGKPWPMQDHEVEKMLGQATTAATAEPEIKIDFNKGDRVKIKEGPFENFDGEVDDVIPAKGLVRVIVNIFGRATQVELEYWQVEAI